jgi:hypothetical protein
MHRHVRRFHPTSPQDSMQSLDGFAEARLADLASRGGRRSLAPDKRARVKVCEPHPVAPRAG